jgi:hypothetical protein
MNYHVPPPENDTGFSGTSKQQAKWDEQILWFNFPDGDNEYHAYRFFGPVILVATHWMETRKGKRFPVMCLNYDTTTGSFAANNCPVCELDPKNSPHKKIQDLQPRQSGLGHAIIRDLEQTGEVKTWRPIRLPISLIIQLKTLRSLNKHIIEGKSYTADVADTHWGTDVYILYQKNSPNPQAKYSVQKGGHTPLTEKEQAFLSQIYDFKSLIQYPTIGDIRDTLHRSGYYELTGGESFGSSTGMGHMGGMILPKVPQPGIAPPPAYLNQDALPRVTTGQHFVQGDTVQAQQPATTFTPPAPQPQFSQPQQVLPPQSVQQAAPRPLPPPPAQSPFTEEEIPFGASAQAPVYSQPQAPVPPPVAAQPVAVPVAPPAAAQPVQQEQASGDTGERVFSYPGSPTGVPVAKFQQIIIEHCETVPPNRGKPMKVWDKDELTNMQVLQCFGSYSGDTYCFKCPIRKQCLRY